MTDAEREAYEERAAIMEYDGGLSREDAERDAGLRLLVCGGRNYADRETAYRVLDAIHAKRPISLLIHGAAKGADTLGAQWAASRGIPAQAYPADWSRGPRGGPERNAKMLAEGRPNGGLVFPGGRGTADMLRRLREAGVTVMQAG